MEKPKRSAAEEFVTIPLDAVELEGNRSVPEGAKAVVLFAHGSGSSRFSPRNRYVADFLRKAGLGTLLFDLLTGDEERVDAMTAEYRFDINLLADRLVAATDWASKDAKTRGLKIGYFGASTGAAAALIAAARRPDAVYAVVSRGGRPDLAEAFLPEVKAPTLLIVGELDYPVVDLNRDALKLIPAVKEMAVVPGATHLFEEPGKLDEVARLAKDWFLEHLK